MLQNNDIKRNLINNKSFQSGELIKSLSNKPQNLMQGFKFFFFLFPLFFLIFFLFISATSSANLIINEVMYDPIENDNYNEWIEIFNPSNKSVNISNWTICDNYAEDTLEPDLDHGNGTTIISSKGYAIITDKGTNFYDNYNVSKKTVCLYVDDKSIGNGLGNNGDSLILKNNENNVTDSVEWIIDDKNITGSPVNAVQEGCSLSRYIGIDNNNSTLDFYEGLIPTPGEENKLIEKGISEISCIKNEFYIRKRQTLDIPIWIKNCGKYSDNLSLRIIDYSFGWKFKFSEEKISLNSGKTYTIFLHATPAKYNGCKDGFVTIRSLSEKKFNISDEITLNFEVFAPDLTIRNIKIYDENNEQVNCSGEGQILRIKAFLKNLGKENGTDVKATFYIDNFSKENQIGYKYYDSVGKYQKYPSILWDTKNIKPGIHRILVVVDEKNEIDETDEINNILSVTFEIKNTTPSVDHKSILISEFYYHSHPNVYNEYIKIFNPINKDLDISNWYFTNTPWKNFKDQRKNIFPNNTIILSNSSMYISENADRFCWETGFLPDFEYNYDSNNSVSQMICDDKFILTNKGGSISLKDSYNHTIDTVVYGNFSYSFEGWSGKNINDSKEGVILKRSSVEKNHFIDTNSSTDWITNRVFKIGQSCFNSEKISFNGQVKTFISPDSSFTAIINEIKNATESIYLNVYEFTHPMLCDVLVDALRRNVSVNLFLEGSPIGGISLEEKYILRRIDSYGGNIRLLKSDIDSLIYSRYSFNHAKYVIIDNKTLIVESCNWAVTGIPVDSNYGNREWGIIIKNSEAAEYFLNVFLDDFNFKRCDSVSYDDYDFFIPEGFFLKDIYTYDENLPIFESIDFIGNFTIRPVLSPDFSLKSVYDFIDSANESIFVEQLYIYKFWDEDINPLVNLLIKKAKIGVDVKVILNYNRFYNDTNEKCNETKIFLEENGAEVKLIDSNWSYFTNVHNKGVIVDNQSVLISSINWNENSFMNNRETGLIIENPEIAKYFAEVFFYDWSLQEPKQELNNSSFKEYVTMDYKNTIYIMIIFTMTFALIARDWRKRKWT